MELWVAKKREGRGGEQGEGGGGGEERRGTRRRGRGGEQGGRRGRRGGGSEGWEVEGLLLQCLSQYSRQFHHGLIPLQYHMLKLRQGSWFNWHFSHFFISSLWLSFSPCLLSCLQISMPYFSRLFIKMVKFRTLLGTPWTLLGTPWILLNIPGTLLETSRLLSRLRNFRTFFNDG